VPALSGLVSRSYRALAIAAVVACALAIALVGHSTPAHADPSLTELEKSMENNWSSLEAVGEKYKQAEDQLGQNQKLSGQLAKQIAPLSTSVDAMYSRVGQAAAMEYKGGNLTAINMVLGSSSPTEALDQVSTLNWIADNQHKAVSTYEKQVNDLTAKKKKYDDLVASNKKTAADLAALKTKLNTDMNRMQQQYMSTAASRSQDRYGLPANMPYIPGNAGKAVRFAIAQLGKPYVWDTAGPDTYDCSGLTMAAWAAAGIYMKHYTYDQADAFPHVAESDLEPGDLVLWNGGEHIGIYIGQGFVIHAPTPGEDVKVSPVNYPGTFWEAVRPSPWAGG
jgi:cell wall-associated NlpC family hydrolase